MKVAIPHVEVSNPDLGQGIQYEFKGMTIEVYREGIIVQGRTEPFRKASEVGALKTLLSIAASQQIAITAMKRFYPPEHEWEL